MSRSSSASPPRRPSASRLAARSARRELLLDAVAEAARLHGPGATMEQIARAAGVTKPILYRHFGDRDGLVLALAERFATDLLDELGAALGRQAPPRELIATTIRAYIAFIERDTPVYRFLTQWARAEHPQAVSGLVAEVSARIARVIEAHLRAAGLDPTPAALWAFGLVGMVHVAGDWWVEQHPHPVDRDRLVEDLTTLLWNGMASYARPAQGSDP